MRTRSILMKGALRCKTWKLSESKEEREMRRSKREKCKTWKLRESKEEKGIK